MLGPLLEVTPAPFRPGEPGFLSARQVQSVCSAPVIVDICVAV